MVVLRNRCPRFKAAPRRRCSVRGGRQVTQRATVAPMRFFTKRYVRCRLFTWHPTSSDIYANGNRFQHAHAQQAVPPSHETRYSSVGRGPAYAVCPAYPIVGT